MNNNQNRIIGYRELHSQRAEKNETKNKLTTAVVLGTIAIVAFLGVKSFDKPTEFSDKTTPYTFEQGEGLNSAAIAVDRIDPKIPYIEVTEHIKNMPENEKALSDGIQAGETITIPESAYRQ